jgi:putative nucleotidyltransferase with HDIG domain
MASKEEIRKGVISSLKPEIDLFNTQELRCQVIEAWTLSISETEFNSLDDLSCSTLIGDLRYPQATQSHHQRAVGRMARSLAENMIKMHGKDVIKIDLDMALACGICHDLGKPYFYDAKNRNRWFENQPYTGNPPYRHTAKGAMLALQAGLPEEVAAAIMNHDIHMEGQYVMRSVYTELVYLADVAYWRTLKILGHMEKEEPVKGIKPGIPAC